MPTIKLYTVKEAAELVGVSTNTLYKYLLEGKIKAARGTHKQGRFRIPVSALEEFLGTSISPDLPPALPTEPCTSSATAPEKCQETQSSLGGRKKILRLLLFLALIILIIDTIISANWSITSAFLRLITFALIIIALYHPKKIV